MSPESLELWNRAVRSHKTAAMLAQEDPDAAVSRAYYAAFYAVSALFAAQGRTFSRHAGVEAAVHRDLVRAGKWSLELGEAFSSLASLRATADYGVEIHATPAQAAQTVEMAEQILQAVRASSSESLP